MTKISCSVCGMPVNTSTSNLHPDNRNFTDEEMRKINDDDYAFSVTHAGCAMAEDPFIRSKMQDERAWITER